MSTKITGTVAEIIYRNPDNGYTVCELDEDDGHIIAATGYMPYVGAGERLELVGDWVEHRDYGRQFKAESFETLLPTDEDAILTYLSSGTISGVGAQTAKNLVAHFGAQTLDIMLKSPERLTEIKGISPKRARKIADSFAELQSVQGIVVFLAKFNIGAQLAMRVHKTLGANAVARIKENPYILSESVEGIGFRTADEIAFVRGMPKNSPVRIYHGVKYLLTAAAYSMGHTYLPRQELAREAAKTLGITPDEAQNGIDELASRREVKLAGEKCMLAMFYDAETYVARRLLSMSVTAPKYTMTDEEADERIARIEQERGITLAPEQKSAVKLCLSSSAAVVTGGPGTGKTTIITTVLALLEDLKLSAVLAAPTGRAAKRISEVTGEEAKTLHRLLGMKPDSGAEGKFTYNESNPLDADVVIADEASMIDILLANALLRAIKPGGKLILCGDADQLPSVGPGNVLRDIISSGAVATAKLSHIFRQAKESLIVVNAHKINSGEMPELSEKRKDFFFLERHGADAIAQTVTELYHTRLPKSYDIDPIARVQVLSPSKKGAAGTAALNRELQFAVNPPDMLKAEHKYGSTVFRVGDKVMQVKNDYDIAWTRDNGELGCGIFNGDIGIIEAISLKDKTMTIIFDDDREVEYPFTTLDRLELAYAITVHKSQGSEFSMVIIPAAGFAPMLMERNLLYTAVTRARDMVIVVGETEYIAKMVGNNTRRRRYTLLAPMMTPTGDS